MAKKSRVKKAIDYLYQITKHEGYCLQIIEMSGCSECPLKDKKENVSDVCENDTVLKRAQIKIRKLEELLCVE